MHRALGLALGLLLGMSPPALAQGWPGARLSLEVGGPGSPDGLAPTLQVALLLTLLSLAPALILTLTSFTRIVVVLSLLRHAVGVPQLPPNQVVVGLALFLTAFVMAPVGQEIHTSAVAPYLARRISETEALQRAAGPLRAFMLRQTREADLALMARLARLPERPSVANLPLHVIVPAYTISELRTAFQLGFLLFLPFLVIDLVVASVLMSMGMFMLPPVMVSLPFKLLLFVLADGWHLVVRALVAGFR
jgi:flagellar biosynthetic protein FliP